MSAAAVYLAHGAAGGWDEIVLLAAPLVAIPILIILARRDREEDGADEPKDPDGAA